MGLFTRVQVAKDQGPLQTGLSHLTENYFTC